VPVGGGGGGGGVGQDPLFPIRTPSAPPPTWKNLIDLDNARRPPDTSQTPWRELGFPPWFSVAIIGAGVAGLRTAMLLQKFGIPYKIFEATERHGGRAFTFQFPPEDPKGKHDYFDVGAMRFPNNNANKPTFDLIKELKLEPKVIPYVFSQPNNIFLF